MTASRVHLVCRIMIVLPAFLCPIALKPLFAQSPTPAASSATQPGPKLPARSTTLPANPAFDVASIHPDNAQPTARTHIYSYADHGHFIAINATLIDLLKYSYVLPESRILDAPAWTKSAKYDIEGKSDPTLAEHLATLPYSEAKPQLLRMVQALLADRFHLAAHLESRELPIYNLVIAPGGVKFSTVKDESKTIDSTTSSGTSTINIRSSSRAMADLAELLYRYTGRVVVDQTGLQGNYTISLRFSSADTPNSETSTSPDAAPSVFTAVREQLGLELKSGKGPVEVLIVDHVDHPTPN